MVPVLEKAQKRIFIADWFFTPELMMKRDPIDPEYRLDVMLKRIAEKGVQIFILIWNAPSITFALEVFFENI